MIFSNPKRFVIAAGAIASVLVFGLAVAYYLFAPRQHNNITQLWKQSKEDSQRTVDHSLWQQVLDDYLVSDDESRVNLFDYQGMIDDEDKTLKTYLDQLAFTNPLELNRDEQFAYWVNLYNALTIKVVVDGYPVESIKEIGNSPLPVGPWNDSVIKINDHPLTLNHIEHSILRPIWQDHRIHFAVNCASIGCPNLQSEAFTASNLERLLEQSARDFLNHPRGIQTLNNELTLSSIFSWYSEDFGETEAEVLKTLSAHLPSEKAKELIELQGTVRYNYDWRLNELK